MTRLPAILGVCLLAGFVANLPAQTTSPAGVVQIGDDQLSRTLLTRRSSSAISKGVKYLLASQQPDGSWSNGGNDAEGPGRTALVTLALLYCGESHQSPPLDRAIKYLKRAQPQQLSPAVYSVALRACVYASLPEVMRRDELRADLRWLQQAMIMTGPNKGMYSYRRDNAETGDFSNSQYGVLGVWYAAQAGLEIPKNYWKLVEDGWRLGQNPDGGWPYRTGQTTSISSMTAAAAATLFITQDYLHADQAQDLNRIWINKPLDDSIKWLGRNFSPERNVGYDQVDPNRVDHDVLSLIGDVGKRPASWAHYMLFGFERVGETSGLTRFGEHRWFEEGSAYLVRSQIDDGSWTGQNGSVVSTAYSLLFLSRGRAPVLLQKLQFDGRWNNRPRDASAFTQFMRRATERHVNWQSISADATPAEFRQSPLLYIASDRTLPLNDEQKLRIKTYLDQGGLLVCLNEGRNNNDFSKSIIALAGEWYPDYAFRDLPMDHVIRSVNFPIPRNEKIRAMGNGVRELIVMYPEGDLSWKWQSTGGAFSPRESPYASLADLWLYATDRANPHFKGEDTWVERDESITADRRARIDRIQYPGNWNPEPGGWNRFANLLHNQNKIDLTSVNAATPANQSLLAYLTGTTSPNLPQASKDAIKSYIDNGGLLVAEAAGGSADAMAGVETFLRGIYPGITIAPLPLDHPMYRAQALGGIDIANNINYRRGAQLQGIHIPRLRGATVNGKLIAILSNEDLSGALVGYNIAGISGYAPGSATDLMRNLVLWRMSLVK